jgi:hypothetical protein
MEISTFNKLYQSVSFQDHLNKEARRYSKRQELQKEYIQEGWLAISQAPPNLSTDEYYSIITIAMESAYWQNRKEILAQKAVFAEPESQILRESFDWLEIMDISTVYIDMGNYK